MRGWYTNCCLGLSPSLLAEAMLYLLRIWCNSLLLGEPWFSFVISFGLFMGLTVSWTLSDMASWSGLLFYFVRCPFFQSRFSILLYKKWLYLKSSPLFFICLQIMPPKRTRATSKKVVASSKCARFSPATDTMSSRGPAQSSSPPTLQPVNLQGFSESITLPGQLLTCWWGKGGVNVIFAGK